MHTCIHILAGIHQNIYTPIQKAMKGKRGRGGGSQKSLGFKGGDRNIVPDSDY